MACLVTPFKKGSSEPSKLFKDAFHILKDRNKAIIVWSIAQDKSLAKDFDIELTEGEEPSAISIIEALQKQGDFLDENSTAAFVEEKENLIGKSYHTFTEALEESNRLENTYKGVHSLVYESGNSFKLTAVNDTTTGRSKKARQLSLEELNRGLTSYLEDLGFAVTTSDKIDTAGVFSPLNAERNANGLIEAIKIAKGKLGQQALPEEFSHVLVEGLINHPLMQRLMRTLTDEVVEELLGDEYESYAEEYRNDKEALQHEAAAKLVAQTIVDTYAIDSGVKFISKKVKNLIEDNLAQGDEGYVENLIAEAHKIADEFIGLDKEDIVEYFDVDAASKSRALYNLAQNIKSMENMSEQAYKLLNKRLKILSLQKSKNSAVTDEDKAALEAIRVSIESKMYATSCFKFLEYVAKDLQSLYKNIDIYKAAMANQKNLGSTDVAGYKSLKTAAANLRKVESVTLAYSDIIEQLVNIDVNEELKAELDESDAEKLKGLALDIKNELSKLTSIYKDARYNTLWNFYRLFWGEKRMIASAKGETEVSLSSIMEGAVGDVNGFSRMVNAMADMPDPLMQLVDTAYKNFATLRDKKVYDVHQRIAAITEKLVKSEGSRDTSFMYEKDENGKPTGMLISDRDYNAYRKALNAYREKLKEQYADKLEISGKINSWINANTEMVTTINIGKDGKKERLPKKSLYPSSAVDNLTSGQREYYDAMMAIKTELDAKLPTRYVHHFRAVQKKADISDSVMSGNASLKSVFNRLKDNFMRDANDVEYGDNGIEEDGRGKQVILDFTGNEVKRIPVYYTSFLKDMSNLEMNMGDALVSYAAVAHNYATMSEVADIMELTSSFAANREVTMTAGGKPLKEFFNSVTGRKSSGDYKIEGKYTNQYNKLKTYIDSNIYGRRKNPETMYMFGKEVDLGKLGDTVKAYSSLVGLGYNVFSGTTNLTMGITQTMLQAAGGEFFGFRNILKANKQYFSLVGSNIADQYSDKKYNKLTLLNLMFDPNEEFLENIMDSNFHSGVTKKLLGKHNPLILNSMGEHYLHNVSMLAILDNKKVKVKNEDGTFTEMSLYDALDVVEKTSEDGNTYKTIELKENTYNLDGTEFNDDSIRQYRSLIQEANHRMHGAFGSVDRGEIHRSVVGRLIMQFRQWMPAFYLERFKSKRINIATNTEEEGFYYTAGKFAMGLISDLMHLKFQWGTRWNMLSSAQKSNILKASFEVSLLYSIMLLISGWSFFGIKPLLKDPDKDDPGVINALKYNLYRLKMELGAAAPTSRDFLDNIMTLINSPAPCIEQIDRLTALLDFSTMFDTIETGKYAGWNRWVKDAYYAMPYAKNIGRVFELADGDISMFNPYIKK